MFLFCDGSVDGQTREGCGAFLVTDDLHTPLHILLNHMHTQVFEDTSSTRLELQTLLWAVGATPSTTMLTVFTDSQNIVGLVDRRKRLEAQQYRAKNASSLALADLYRALFTLRDLRALNLVKIQGHLRRADKTQVDQIFSLVDRAARAGCRANRAKRSASE